MESLPGKKIQELIKKNNLSGLSESKANVMSLIHSLVKTLSGKRRRNPNRKRRKKYTANTKRFARSKNEENNLQYRE